MCAFRLIFITKLLLVKNALHHFISPIKFMQCTMGLAAESAVLRHKKRAPEGTLFLCLYFLTKK
jgi:hypothetical protein